MLTSISHKEISHLIKPRQKNTHKGDFGNLLIIGGNEGMAGAVHLAAQSALYTGVGCATIFTREHYNNFNPIFPEIMLYTNMQKLDELLHKASVCILGPGLADDAWAIDLFNKITNLSIPLLLDASALRILAQKKIKNNNWILTPHPGEAAALLNITAKDVQKDRFESAKKIQKNYGGVTVLKGMDTLILSNNSSNICHLGNPGMSSAGMGDVLSGVIGSLIAQGLSLLDAACLGVWLHAKSGDDLSHKYGARGIIAHELMPYLRQNLNDLEK